MSTAAPPAGARRWVLDFVLLGALWGASFLFMRSAVTEFGPVPTAGARVAIAAAMLLPLMFWRGFGPAFALHWRGAMAIGVLNSAVPFALYAFAVSIIPTGLAAILNATVPLFGALVAWVWLHDRPGPWRVLGLALGFVGVALLASGKGSVVPVGASTIAPGWAIAACLCATLCYGISASATRRHLPHVPPLVAAAGSQLGAALALLLPALWLAPAQWPSAKGWAALLVLGLFCTGLAYLMYFRLLAIAGPTQALAVTFIIPAFAVGYGALLLGEPITLRMVLCGAIIVLGTALSTGLLKPRRPALRR